MRVSMGSARHVRIRYRTFHDEADLRRWSREIKFLAAPVTLLDLAPTLLATLSPAPSTHTQLSTARQPRQQRHQRSGRTTRLPGARLCGQPHFAN